MVCGGGFDDMRRCHHKYHMSGVCFGYLPDGYQMSRMEREMTEDITTCAEVVCH